MDYITKDTTIKEDGSFTPLEIYSLLKSNFI